jgi:hypothetical protein
MDDRHWDEVLANPWIIDPTRSKRWKLPIVGFICKQSESSQQSTVGSAADPFDNISISVAGIFPLLGFGIGDRSEKKKEEEGSRWSWRV